MVLEVPGVQAHVQKLSCTTEVTNFSFEHETSLTDCFISGPPDNQSAASINQLRQKCHDLAFGTYIVLVAEGGEVPVMAAERHVQNNNTHCV